MSAEPPILSRGTPVASARQFMGLARPTLMHTNDDWLAYDGSAYVELEKATVRSEVYRFLEQAQTKNKDGDLRDFNPDSDAVSKVIDALKGVAHRARDIYTPPCWLDDGRDRPPPRELIACRNGLLHLPTGELLPPTPDYFTRNTLDFGHDPSAPPPKQFLKFLSDLWESGDEIGLLQEIFGYLLTPDVSLHKIFPIIGPTRAGKGTIAHILRALVGGHNTCAPTLNSLEKEFGLAPLIAKQVAIVSDMRIGKNTDRDAVVENLLRISGGDAVDANRKFKDPWHGQLAVRFVMLSNEFPQLPDDSGALANRMVPLIMTKSFLGKEDHGLLDKLLGELPGILLWSIEGWRRLRERGHFELPEASRDAIGDVHALGSPVMAFIEERCELDVEAVTTKDNVWSAWQNWCRDRNVHAGTKSHFSARLLTTGRGRISAVKPRQGGDRVPSYRGIEVRVPDEIPF